MSQIIFLFISLFVFSDGNNRIQNGVVVSSKNPLSRSVALLRFGDGGLCSATFLTKKILITAGHCTYNVSLYGSSARIRDENGKWHSRSLVRKLTHPDYKYEEYKWGPKVKNDIALVEIKSEFPVAVRPMKIGTVSDITQKTTVTIAGYGWNEEGYGEGQLRTGEMWAVVAKIYQFFDRYGLLLSDKKKQVICPGDSGGPVLKGTSSSVELIGVNSMSNGCRGHSDFLRAMAEIVPTYKVWIQKYLSKDTLK